MFLRELRYEDSGDNDKVKAYRLNLQNKNIGRDALGFVHFFTITARLRRENALFHDLSGRKQPRRRNFLSQSELGYGS